MLRCKGAIVPLPQFPIRAQCLVPWLRISVMVDIRFGHVDTLSSPY